MYLTHLFTSKNMCSCKIYTVSFLPVYSSMKSNLGECFTTLASEYSDTNKAQDILHTGHTDYISHYKYNKVYSLTCLNVPDTNFCQNVLNLNM